MIGQASLAVLAPSILTGRSDFHNTTQLGVTYLSPIVIQLAASFAAPTC